MAVHHALNPDAGAAGATWQLAEEYRRLGHETNICSFDDLPRWIPEKLRPLLFPWYVAWRIYAHPRSRPDVADISTGDGWVAAILRNRDRGPLIVTRSYGLEHTAHLAYLADVSRGELADPTWRYRLYYGGFRLWEVATSLRSADLTLMVSQHDARFACNVLGIPAENVRVVAHGAPKVFADRPIEPTPKSPEEAIGVAIIGSHISRKGVRYAAEALNAILTTYPQVHLGLMGTIYGRDDVVRAYAPAVRSRISVIPTYRRHQLPSLLAGYVINLFPSLYEGFSLALAEAMACGLAPVVTSAPGVSEFLTDGQDALIVSPADSGALQGALERLILDRILLDRIRNAAHRTARQFTWPIIAGRTIEYYEEALNRRRQPLLSPERVE